MIENERQRLVTKLQEARLLRGLKELELDADPMIDSRLIAIEREAIESELLVLREQLRVYSEGE